MEVQAAASAAGSSAGAKSMHVLIVGAGPGGLLTAINLLRRNKYTVEIVDAGEDFGLVEDLTKKRSWMIGLAWPGLRAIGRVPDLFEKYVSKVGVHITKRALYIGSKKLLSDSGDVGTDAQNYLVDRNYIVAALARYLHDHFKDSPNLRMRYQTRLNFVDPECRQIQVRRASDGTDEYLPYDLLVGADGVRSGVRQAFVAGHRDFECSVEDIFERFKSVHVDLPESMEPNCMHVFPSCLRNINGVGMCETGGRINFSMGHRRHAPPDEELYSSDASVVADYFRRNFKAVKALPYDEVAKAWVEMDWQSTAMTHCNYYHSEKLQALILGDAAHATSPSIGMGMNHALGDAACLDELLHEHGDDLSKVLPAFSARRVKEGQALTDMADLIQSYKTGQNIWMAMRQVARGIGHYLLPSRVEAEPYIAIAKGMKLSEAYAILVRTGRLPAIRQTNAAIKRAYFEKITGMVPPPPPGGCLCRRLTAVVGFFFGRRQPQPVMCATAAKGQTGHGEEDYPPTLLGG